MARPKSTNPGKAVTLYLSGHALNQLATIHHSPAEAIRTLIRVHLPPPLPQSPPTIPTSTKTTIQPTQSTT